jgi:two-component system phosphate regulon sensor histidine kinase PhoR
MPRGTNQPIWLRLGLIMGLLVVGVEVAFTWFLIARQHEQALRQAERDLGRVIEFLSPRYEEMIRTLTDAQLRHALASDTLPIGLRLSIRFPDGRVVTPESPAQDESVGLERTRTLAGADGLPAGELIAARASVDLGGGTFRDIAGIAAFGLGVLAVSLAAVFAVSAHLSARLARIAEGAGRFASGDLRHRIEPVPSRELAALAAALNGMAEQLHARIGQLRTQQNEQESILRSMEQGVVAIDASQRVLRMNAFARRLFGVGDRDVRGLRFDEVVSDAALRRFAADAIADPSRRTEDFVLQTPARRVDLRATSGALLDAEDEPVGAIVLLADMSQLRRLETVRSDFAANVSHELRTPITNIKGYVETLMEMQAGGRGSADPSGPDTAGSFLKVIARNADRLGAIVDDMLTLTNLERTDGQQLPTAPTPAGLVIGSVRSSMARLAQERGIELRTHAEEGLRVMANQRLAEQALANLVGNAIKYSPSGTRVEIEARPAVLESGEPGVRFSVRDQGPGIPPDHLARIFERFYRVDKARSREQGGTGLGLSIVKHIAIVHGGAVSVESTLGQGSVFSLLLPAAAMGMDRRRAEVGGTPAGET